MQRWWRTYQEERIEPRLYLLRELRSTVGPLVACMVVLNLVVGAIPGCFMIASSVVVGRTPAAVAGGLNSGAWGSLVAAFGVSAAILFAQQILTPLSVSLGQVLKHQVDGVFHSQILAASLKGTGIAALEDHTAVSQLRMAAEQLRLGFRTPGDAAAGTVALVVRYAQLATYGILLWVAVDWWAAIVICVVTMTFRVGHRAVVRVYTRLWPVMQPLRREAEYFRELGMGPAAAKETRVFGLDGWIGERYRDRALSALRPVFSARRKANGVAFFWRTAFGIVVAGGVLVLMLRSAAEGHVSLTHLALGTQAALGAIALGEFYPESDTNTQFGMMSVAALREFEQSAAAIEGPTVVQTEQGAGSAEPLRECVRFEGVSFSYPGSDRLVLDGLDLTIRAGECTALVGLNGSGKTTLVKLLSRLYEPTGGKITADGVDIASFQTDDWRRQLAVIFQDFNRYQLSVSDNIAFGAIDRPVNEEEIAAVASTAGLDAAVEKLPRGLNTLLSRQLEGGAELSGGQWQRVAIARALYAVDHGAGVLVLDEPTSALDVRAEAAFYEEFIAQARGRTTLLISHRFSSIRHADRIVVLEGGRLIEDGTHESLLEQDGRYAELFNLQAHRFAAGEELEDEVA